MNQEFRRELHELVEKKGTSVSIYMPTHRAGAEVQQDPIRLKNLLREAEQQLIGQGMRQPEAKDLLAPAHELVGNSFFWRNQAEGLAVFIGFDLFRTYSLPIRFEEQSMVNDSFYLKPLLRLFGEDGRFFVLALSQKSPKLFTCTRFRVDLVEVEGLPKGIDDALKYDDPQRQLQHHTSTQGLGPGRRAGIFHGHGVGIDDTKPNLLRYCQMIDDSLHEVLKEERAPLILAGVDYILPIYRQASKYTHLLEKGITGNPDLLSAEDLHAKAWELVRPHFIATQKQAEAKYFELAGTGLASTDTREIVAAASFGRIETLFMKRGARQWGTFNPDTGEVVLHETAQSGGQDLLDLAAIETFLNGGAVYILEPEQVPENQEAAAVFRY